MINSRRSVIASSVREGVAMLNVMSGVGCRHSEVNEDMVMPLGTDSAPVDVHTTTEFGRRRITERNCSGPGRASKRVSECGCGCSDGGVEREIFQGVLRAGKVVNDLALVPKAPSTRAHFRSSWRARPEQVGAALKLHDFGESDLDTAHLPNWRKTHALLISAHGTKNVGGC